MTRGRAVRPAVSTLLALLTLAGCGHGTAPPVAAAAHTPSSAGQLERLVVTSVPSGLPRMPDDELQPPAGEKDLADVASYAGDPARERQALQRYGFRFGWERFWGRGTAETSVFVDQFRRASSARSFTADVASNDAGHYRATPHEGTGGLPAGCRLLTVARPEPDTGLNGPAAFGWCGRGVFSVAVTAVSDTPAHALAEVSAVVRAQLDRLG